VGLKKEVEEVLKELNEILASDNIQDKSTANTYTRHLT